MRAEVVAAVVLTVTLSIILYGHTLLVHDDLRPSDDELAVPASKRPLDDDPTTSLSRPPKPDLPVQPAKFMDVLHSLPHPSCEAEEALRKAGTAPVWNRKGWNCFKHGGHYKPGYPRNRGEYVVLRDVYHHNGKFYSATVEGTPLRVQYSGHFSMISGNWPQTVVRELNVHPLGALDKALRSAAVSVPTGYYQPPTDYLSVYHVIVEVVFPMFHSLHRYIAAAMAEGRVGADVKVFTGRPMHSRYGFKPKSCHEGPACLNTLWAEMYTDAVGGKSNVIGLEKADVEANRPAYRIGTLHVGNPTHCEPLWGPDGYFIERVPSVSNGEAMRDCGQVLWDFRRFYLRRHDVVSKADSIKPLSEAAVATPRIVVVSRKGDWARFLQNEEDIVAKLNEHMSRAHSVHGSVSLVKINGTLKQQLAAVVPATIYIANHGAGIIPSLYLRPNAGVVTISLDAPGFYPWISIPPWLHWRDVVARQVCNPRLWKGKCKLSGPNNNDMFLDMATQFPKLTEAVDAILKQQREFPKEAPTADNL